ncbi:hypothetical protein M5C99_13800 [Acidovorax sp. NCPPB 2350]|nr:hypothetical protein M5C99_13800 [Acidovorax sp. NCPPB 2350]
MKRKTFGYGLSAKPALPTTPASPTRPEVTAFKKKIFHAYKLLIGFAVVLALLLPPDARQMSSALAAWVEIVQRAVPYVHWIEQNSKIPNVAAVWFAIVWPLIFIYLLYLIVQFPYRCAHSMFRAAAPSEWKNLQVGLILLFFSWMAYWIFFDRQVAQVKSVTQGHARLIEAIAIDSRLGLALVSPWVISLCLVIWATTLAFTLGFFGRFFVDDENDKEDLK